MLSCSKYPRGSVEGKSHLNEQHQVVSARERLGALPHNHKHLFNNNKKAQSSFNQW